MSRVDEALRRAAEQSLTDGGGTPASAVLPEDHIARLAEEPFSVELSERRRVSRGPEQRDVTDQTRAVAAAAAAVSAEPLLERVSVTLAQKIVIDKNMVSASREQYRRMAATLHRTQAEHGLKVVMITSAIPGEGKTLTSSNLALTFSESYERNVLLIDADLRRPTLHTVFGFEQTTGLSEGLRPEANGRMQLKQVSPKLAVLPAGRPTSNPMAALTSERMRQLLSEARRTFDWIFIDTPPLALLTDANLLSSIVDGAVLVVKADSTPYELVRRAADAIGRDRTLGVVLNRAKSSMHSAGYGYYDDDYYYGATGE